MLSECYDSWVEQRTTTFSKVGHANWVDWAGYKVDRWSTSGLLFSIGSGAISWSSKKQPIVALSSIEAEYKGLAIVVACEVVWLKRILKDLGVSINNPGLILAPSTWLGTRYSMLGQSTPRCTTTSFESVSLQGMSTFNISIPIFKWSTSSRKL